MINFIENLISEEMHDAVFNYTSSGCFPFYYFKDTGKDNYKDKKIFEETTREFPLFSHFFVNECRLNSDHFHIVSGVCKKIEDEIKKTEQKNLILSRVRLNLLTKQPNIDDKIHTHFHTDLNDSEGYTAIYYMNDSDGNTLFYEDENIFEVKPQKGLAVYFNSNTLHAMKMPKNTTARFALNINWIYEN